MCTSPKTAWMPKTQNDRGTKPLLFRKPEKLDNYEVVQVPCRKCDECIKSKALQWAIRMHCELKTTTKPSWFVTLTYEDNHLPRDYNLNQSDVQKFIKDTRRKYGSMRYVNKGEYGERFGRPHFHLALFGIELTDLTPKVGKKGYILYESPSLTKIWGKGNVIIGELTMESCLYIAKYMNKSSDAQEIDPMTGEINSTKTPEYMTMSTKPGIGYKWFSKWGATDLGLGNDFMITQNGSKAPVPEFFDKQLKKDNPELYDMVKQERLKNTNLRSPEKNLYQADYNRVINKQKKRNKKYLK